MKKFALLLLAALGFASCNSGVGPEYSTPPVITSFTYPNSVKAGERVNVNVVLTSSYGLGFAVLQYELNDDGNKKTATQKIYESVSLGTATFEGAIPAHVEGTKVKFQVAVTNYYSALAMTDIIEYTVGEAATEPLPPGSKE